MDRSRNSDFIDFMSRTPPEKRDNDDAVSSFDFMATGLDSRNDAFSSIRNYSSLDALDPTKFSMGTTQKPVNLSLDAPLLSEIDRAMQKYADNLMHAIDGIADRLSQLETRTGNLEHSMDDLKVSFGNSHGSAEGKMKQLENILREVQSGVQVIRDKQEVVEAQLLIAKLQVPKVDQEVKIMNNPYSDPAQPGASLHQQFSTISLTQPPPTLPQPNAPPPPPSPPAHQNLQPQVQLPDHVPHNQVPSIPHRDSYFLPPGQTLEIPTQQYQIPPLQQIHPPPPPTPPQHQYQSPPQPQYSQALPPQQPHHPEGTQYPPPQICPPGMQPPPASQQFYSPTSNVYEQPLSRPAPEYSAPFGPSSLGHGEPYPYSSPVKPQQLPTARILPQALPKVSVGGGGGGSGSGNRVPIDDVVDKVTHMGFPRDQVRATVRRLTENGQSVDLNAVLDKLMNDGEGRGWSGR